MLTRQDRCRAKNHRLEAAHDAFENRPHGDFCLTEPYIAANEHIHGLRPFHTALYRLYGLQLVIRLHKGKRILKLTLLRRIGKERNSLRDFTVCVNGQQFFCQFLNRLFGFSPYFIPLDTAHTVKSRGLPFRTDIFFKTGNLLHGEVKFVRPGILDGNIVPVDTFQFNGFYPDIFSDAMDTLHYIISRLQIGEISDLFSFSSGFIPSCLLLSEDISRCDKSHLRIRQFKAAGKDAIVQRNFSFLHIL